MSNVRRIKCMSQVLVVSDLTRSLAYYNRLGFHTDHWGHADLEGLTLLLRQARRPEDVRPLSRVPMVEGSHTYPHNDHDTFAYGPSAEAIDDLYAQFKANGASFAFELFTAESVDMRWRKFGLKDPDCYVITFGAMF
jgi:catechol 2,3-dioxygenase-like lactoylglutathione lyase family enzyme